MTTMSSSLTRAGPVASVLVGVALLGLLAACGSSPSKAASDTTTPTVASSPTTSASTSISSSLKKLEALSTSVKAAEKATFKAVYTVTNAGTTQTVTIEQSPPKSVFSIKSESVIDTGTATYICTDSGTETCLSEGTANPLASLVAVFSPATVLTALQSAQAQADAHAAGYNLSFSSGTYGGQSTTCANISGTTTAKYCVTGGGILAYVSANGGTFELSSYSSSPPASDFALPAGATVDTIPSGA